MHIAFVFDVFFPRITGILTASLHFAKYLIEKGHKVTFIAPKRAESRLMSIENIPVHYVPGIPSFSPGISYCSPWNSKLKRFLKEQKIDCVHLSAPCFLNLACLNAAKALKIRAIQTFHTNLYHPQYVAQAVPFFWMHRIIIKLIDLFIFSHFFNHCYTTIVPSKVMADFLQKRYPSRTFRVIPNKLDVEKFDCVDSLEQLREKYPLFDSRFAVVYAGRLAREKELEVLLSAMKEISHPEIRLFVIGDGPEGPAYQRMSRELKLEDRVFFLGQIPNAELIQSGLLHHCRVFVSPSTSEVCSICTLEAICSHAPIIVADVPINRELVQENGLLFEPGKPKLLAQAIVRLCEDDALHASCVNNAKKKKIALKGQNNFAEIESLYFEAVR